MDIKEKNNPGGIESLFAIPGDIKVPNIKAHNKNMNMLKSTWMTMMLRTMTGFWEMMTMNSVANNKDEYAMSPPVSVISEVIGITYPVYNIWENMKILTDKIYLVPRKCSV